MEPEPFFRQLLQQEQEENNSNKMNSDMSSVPDLKI